MATAPLSGSVRDNTGKGAARSVRRDGQVPAVIYGHGRDPQSLAINTRELEKLLEHISAENTVIDLSFDGKSSRTLIREIQRHPFKRQILHVDFQELVAGEKVIVPGATGAAGRLAVQLAKNAGASQVIAVGRSAEALEQVKALGYMQAPVVVTDGDHWSGFRPDKIDELASRLA